VGVRGERVVPRVADHPAKFSESVLDAILSLASKYELGEAPLDPFGGTGGLTHIFPDAVCVEIEQDWATDVCGNALCLPFLNGAFRWACTSPTFGNRMADAHNARDSSKRITYRHTIGHPLHTDNSGQMNWGPNYRIFHRLAWLELGRVTREYFILNISDHYRKGVIVPVSAWHVVVLVSQGWELIDSQEVATPRMRFGANQALRVEAENVFVFRRVSL
jgi:hypothetical protein